jgi:hypothetical protein
VGPRFRNVFDGFGESFWRADDTEDLHRDHVAVGTVCGGGSGLGPSCRLWLALLGARLPWLEVAPSIVPIPRGTCRSADCYPQRCEPTRGEP